MAYFKKAPTPELVIFTRPKIMTPVTCADVVILENVRVWHKIQAETVSSKRDRLRHRAVIEDIDKVLTKDHFGYDMEYGSG